jgi:hypothetical protein
MPDSALDCSHLRNRRACADQNDLRKFCFGPPNRGDFHRLSLRMSEWFCSQQTHSRGHCQKAAAPVPPNPPVTILYECPGVFFHAFGIVARLCDDFRTGFPSRQPESPRMLL